MAWIAVDKDGEEYIYSSLPVRGDEGTFTSSDSWISLPKGSALKLTGFELTWEDEPIDLRN